MKSFNQFLEVKKEELAKIGTHVNKILRKEMEDMPLNDIFGNKTRVIIPLTNKEEYDFQHELEKKGYQVNLKQGQVSSKIKTQIGEKEKTERIGKVINSLIKKEPEHSEKWKRSLNWWEKSKENIGKQGVSIVVSRHPIDILRMSDHSEWSSCHSPGREYFKCAIQEAKTGGAVAYVVKNSDLQNLQDLQKKDIFADPDRKIEGVEPLERLRLRRLSNEDVSLLLPEKRTYGIKHIGFLETVLKWARDSQRNKIDFANPPEFKDFGLHGGSYQDTSAAEIWNQFFGTDVYGSKTSKEQPEEVVKVDPDRLEEAAQRIIREHELKHYSVYASVEISEGEPYLFYDASVCFDFDLNGFLKTPDEKDLRMYGQEETLGKQMKNVLRDIWTIEQIEIDKHGQQIRFCLQLSDEERGGELDDLERYLDNLDDFDKHYDEDQDKIREVLIEKGWIRNWKENLKFKHFKLEIDPAASYVKKTYGNRKDVLTIVSEEMWIGDLLGINTKDVKLNVNRSLEFQKKSAQATAMIFPNFIEEDHVKILWEKPATLQSVEAKYPAVHSGPGEIINHRIKVKLFLEIELPSNHEERIKLLNGIKYIDKNWNYFEKRAIDWWNKISLLLKSGDKVNYAEKTPIKHPVYPKQPELPFGESFKYFLEKNV